ncbi:MAG: tRNA (adenosine(37)-N6)-threonylcarbamoyltransferase complex dimerization subunit type 1 TsaB [Deltaproteobacteria bacterium]|jgi:tRNA threonylcarbamoyl adenosine modification protein YeaZ|nr:tRNA (adenosine(37)-N6)-threonylcarbamoyltransferase complex dimerization subunit type 1 TsaB [Deltaproteobacteria bacterium]
MLILAWDTASTSLGLALASFSSAGCQTLYNYVGAGLASHGQTLAPLVDEALKNQGLKPSDLGLLAVGCGPGSFTGLRVGLALAKGLAFASQSPVAGFSSLAILATQAQTQGLVAPVMDARHREIFTALYRVESGQLEPLTEVLALSPDKLWPVLETFNPKGERVTVTGPGLDLLSPRPAWVDLGPKDSPSALTLAQMANLIFEKGQLAQYPPIPLYGRSPEIFKTFCPPQRLAQRSEAN